MFDVPECNTAKNSTYGVFVVHQSQEFYSNSIDFDFSISLQINQTRVLYSSYKSWWRLKSKPLKHCMLSGFTNKCSTCCPYGLHFFRM